VDSFDADRLGAERAGWGNAKRMLLGTSLDLDPLDLLERLDAALDLARLGRLVAERFV
jgi:hypothetical protein